MSYWVYVNRGRKRACWHKEGCGYIKMHGGEGAADQDWFRCESLDEVQSILNRETRAFDSDQVKPCASCLGSQ